MADDWLDEVAANVSILIAEEMDVQHRFGAHPDPVPDCWICLSRGGARP